MPGTHPQGWVRPARCAQPESLRHAKTCARSQHRTSAGVMARRWSPVRPARRTHGQSFQGTQGRQERLGKHIPGEPGQGMLFECRWTVHGQQLTIAHDPHPPAVFRLVHIMGGHQGGHPLGNHGVDQIPKARRAVGSTPLVGSSRNSKRGWWTMAVPSARRCFQPVDRFADPLSFQRA